MTTRNFDFFYFIHIRFIAQCGRKMYNLEFPWGMVSNGLLMTDRKIDELLGAGSAPENVMTAETSFSAT